MIELTKMQWLILNATADDFENLENIYRSICLEFSAEKFDPTDPKAFYWREAEDAVPLSEIVEAIRVLVDRRLLSVRLPQDNAALPSSDLSYLWSGWFGITGLGRMALTSELNNVK
jgi:hypothetical protein